MIPRSLSAVMSEVMRSTLNDLWIATPATVQSYAASTQTVTVVLGIIRQLPDDTGLLQEEEPPVLMDVPVLFPRSTSFSLTFPLASGDHGLVVFCDRNIGEWRAKGKQCPAGDAEIMGASGAVFIPGLWPDSGALPSASSSNLALGHKTGAQLQITSSVVEARPAPGTAAADFVALANMVKTELNSIIDAFKNHTHTTAGTGAPVGPTALVPPGPIVLPAVTSVAATVLKSS